MSGYFNPPPGAASAEGWRLGHLKTQLNAAADDLVYLADKFRAVAEAAAPGDKHTASVVRLLRDTNNAMANLSLGTAIEAAAEADTFARVDAAVAEVRNAARLP